MFLQELVKLKCKTEPVALFDILCLGVYYVFFFGCLKL